jgi:undecaprenyl-diphosphatase
VRDTVIIGAAQALALMPGVSRSGSTLTAGLFLGLRRADAARFSFLLGTPLVILAGLKGLADILDANPSGSEITTMLVGIIFSAVSGFAAISILLRYLQRSNASVFVIYRLVAGLFILGLIAAGVR